MMQVLEISETLKTSLLSKIKSVGNIVTGMKMPEQAPLYTGWKVTEVDGKLTCMRVLMPFKELLKGIEGLNSKIIKTMPDKQVWFTLFVDEVAEEYANNVPELDLGFMPDPKHVSMLIDVLMQPLIPGYGRGYYGWGEAGVGKTSTALWLLSVLRMACVHMNCRPNMDVEEFFLSTIAVDGKWQQQEGPLLKAILNDWPIIVDELDLGPAEFWPALNNLVEGRRYALPSYQEGYIQAKSCFRLIGFGNTGPNGSEIGNFAGRSQIDGSVWDRFFKDYYGKLCSTQLKMIIRNNFSEEDVSEELAKQISAFVTTINSNAASGSFPEMISPRSLIAMINMFIANKDCSRSPLLLAIGTVLGSIQDSEENLESMLNVYALSICENALSVRDLKKQWNERYKAPKCGKSSDEEDLSEEGAEEASETETTTTASDEGAA